MSTRAKLRRRAISSYQASRNIARGLLRIPARSLPIRRHFDFQRLISLAGFSANRRSVDMFSAACPTLPPTLPDCPQNTTHPSRRICLMGNFVSRAFVHAGWGFLANAVESGRRSSARAALASRKRLRYSFRRSSDMGAADPRASEMGAGGAVSWKNPASRLAPASFIGSVQKYTLFRSGLSSVSPHSPMTRLTSRSSDVRTCSPSLDLAPLPGLNTSAAYPPTVAADYCGMSEASSASAAPIPNEYAPQ